MKHNPNRPTVPQVMPLVRALYSGKRQCSRNTGSVGGCLHIVLDDGNASNSSVEFCVDFALEHDCANCAELAQLILQMSPTQRLKLGRER